MFGETKPYSQNKIKYWPHFGILFLVIVVANNFLQNHALKLFDYFLLIAGANHIVKNSFHDAKFFNLTQFNATLRFYNPWKLQRFSDVFKGYRNITLG